MGFDVPSLEKIKLVLEQAEKIHNYNEYRFKIFVTLSLRIMTLLLFCRRTGRRH